MNYKNFMKEKSVIVCLNGKIIHLCDPFEYIWICDETKVADNNLCEQRDRLLIKDFLTFSIQKTELLRNFGKLGDIWKKMDKKIDKYNSVAEDFLSKINEYYLEESPLMKNATMCKDCLRIFLGNLYELGNENVFI
ncbi:hypothetical protein MHK_005970 [Candidatus Magnetomorum sp. HK-1]|nr:hypothetical protein MHK_005970 [Candidatus Magnetomorum sp. HK-1]